MKKEDNNFNTAFDTDLKKYLLYSFLYDAELILALLKEFLNVEYKKEDRLMFLYDQNDIKNGALDAIGVTRIELDGFRRELCGLKYLHDENGNAFLLLVHYEIHEDGDHNLTCRNAKAVAVYLKIENAATTKEEVKVTLEAPNGLLASYKVPTKRITDCNLAELIERKLYVLIPFLFYSVGKTWLPTGKGDFDKLGELCKGILQQLKEAVIDGRMSLDIMDFVREKNEKVIARLSYEYGEKAGEKKLEKLIKQLTEAGDMDSVVKAINDDGYCRNLYEKVKTE